MERAGSLFPRTPLNLYHAGSTEYHAGSTEPVKELRLRVACQKVRNFLATSRSIAPRVLFECELFNAQNFNDLEADQKGCR